MFIVSVKYHADFLQALQTLLRHSTALYVALLTSQPFAELVPIG